MIVRCPGPHVNFGGRAISWFHLTGLAGAGASISVFLIGAHIRSLPAWPLLPLIAIAIVIFLGIAMVTKVVTGQERLTYYHNELVILGGAALFLYAVHQPMLAYLDLVAVAISAFLVGGRVGCCLVGCCHGRPGQHGLVYGAAHVDAGFPASYAGVPLVPVQLLEAATAASIVIVALLIMGAGAPDGSALAVTFIGYGAARFAFELVRGDVRPTRAGLSEAQWTSAVISALVLTAVLRGASGVPTGAIVVAAAVIAAAAARVVTHRGVRSLRRQLRGPTHVDALLAFIKGEARADGEVGLPLRIVTTSLGVIVSADPATLSADSVSHDRHWAMSWPGHGLDEDDGQWMANLIATTVGNRCQARVILGDGVIHVVLSPTALAGPKPSTDVHMPDEPSSPTSFEMVRASSTSASLNPFAA